MRLLDPIRNNPVAALCVVVAGVVGWAASGFLRPDPQPVGHNGPELAPPVQGFRPVTDMDDFTPTPPEHQSIPADMLPRLKPGMTRVEIETILGPPTATSLHPVTVTGGKPTYQMAYELAEPDAPPTVRPLRIPRPPRDPGQPKSLVALEFDASQPGHPLLGVLYLDPLF